MNLPDVQQSGDGMWIPMPLAMKLLECYFGGGPRSATAPDPSTPPAHVTPIAPVPPTEFVPVPTTSNPALVDAVRNPYRGWKPRGVAAKPYAMGEPPPEGTAP